MSLKDNPCPSAIKTMLIVLVLSEMNKEKLIISPYKWELFHLFCYGASYESVCEKN